MNHPFIPDLSDKSLEELQKTISDLMGKLTFAHRTGNISLVHQINMALTSYKSAYSNKMDNLVKTEKINAKISIDKK